MNDSAPSAMWFLCVICPKSFFLWCAITSSSLLTFKQPLPFSWLTTPLSLWRGAGGEALYALYYFTLNYQQYHQPQLTPKLLASFPWLTTPLPLRGGAGGEALSALYHFTFHYQPRRAHNYFISQLGTSCSFDSSGLARNEPTPGKRSHGDSTP